MSRYQADRDEHGLPMYEFTTQLATLEPPPEELRHLLAAIHTSTRADMTCEPGKPTALAISGQACSLRSMRTRARWRRCAHHGTASTVPPMTSACGSGEVTGPAGRDGQPSPGRQRHRRRAARPRQGCPLSRAEGTVRTSLPPASGHTPPGSRASPGGAVMDLPEVQDSARLEATVPLGDARIAGAAAGAGRGHRHRSGRVDRPGGCGHTARQPGGGQRTAWRRRAIGLVIAAR